MVASGASGAPLLGDLCASAEVHGLSKGFSGWLEFTVTSSSLGFHLAAPGGCLHSLRQFHPPQGQVQSDSLAGNFWSRVSILPLPPSICLHTPATRSPSSSEARDSPPCAESGNEFPEAGWGAQVTPGLLSFILRCRQITALHCLLPSVWKPLFWQFCLAFCLPYGTRKTNSGVS
jgi:hypothetical protein